MEFSIRESFSGLSFYKRGINRQLNQSVNILGARKYFLKVRSPKALFFCFVSLNLKHNRGCVTLTSLLAHFKTNTDKSLFFSS